ncbi:hypothetical protein VTO42DRAFT_1089 [Malbranchea cinnamomea]
MSARRTSPWLSPTSADSNEFPSMNDRFPCGEVVEILPSRQSGASGLRSWRSALRADCLEQSLIPIDPAIVASEDLVSVELPRMAATLFDAIFFGPVPTTRQRDRKKVRTKRPRVGTEPTLQAALVRANLRDKLVFLAWLLEEAIGDQRCSPVSPGRDGGARRAVSRILRARGHRGAPDEPSELEPWKKSLNGLKDRKRWHKRRRKAGHVHVQRHKVKTVDRTVRRLHSVQRMLHSRRLEVPFSIV